MAGVHVSCAVRSDKWVYEVFGRRIADGSLLFWVERAEAPGEVWMHISHSVVPTGVDPQTEFVAATEGGMNDVLADVALQTGWFAKTGRTVHHPEGQRNEVWSITPACPIPVAEISTVDLRGLRLSELLAEWARRMRDLGLTAVVVTVPDPFDGARPPRKVAGTFPGDLGPVFAKWNPEGSTISTGVQIGSVADLPEVGNRLTERGYASWIALRLPWQSGVALEVLMFSHETSMDQGRAALATMRTLEMSILIWRAAADVVVRITDRERDVLRKAIEGHTAEQTATLLGLKENTVGYHVANVVRKFGAESKLHAVIRAMMLGSLLDPEQP